MGSEHVLNGNIHTATYSMSKNTAFPKRAATDIRGQNCTTVCAVGKAEAPVLDDCQDLYNGLLNDNQTLTLEPGTSHSLPQD